MKETQKNCSHSGQWAISVSIRKGRRCICNQCGIERKLVQPKGYIIKMIKIETEKYKLKPEVFYQEKNRFEIINDFAKGLIKKIK